jgi:hypothetical protein
MGTRVGTTQDHRERLLFRDAALDLHADVRQVEVNDPRAFRGTARQADERLVPLLQPAARRGGIGRRLPLGRPGGVVAIDDLEHGEHPFLT